MNERDLVAVARLYRRATIAGLGDHGGYEAAVVALGRRHPALSDDEVRRAVAVLIRDGSQRWGDWFYGRDRASMELRRRNVQLIAEILRRRQASAAGSADDLAAGIVNDLAAVGIELFSEEDLDALDDTPRIPADRS